MIRERIKVRPLLAVAAALSLAACGSSQPTAGTTAPTTNAASPPPVPGPTTNEAPTVGAVEGSPTVQPTNNAAASPAPATTEAPAAKPLTMPNGSPACGNVATRAPPNPNCKK